MTGDPAGLKPPARPPSPPRDPVTERLLASRVELLDLSLRNPMLHYRPSTRRGVETVDEKAAAVFTWLVGERQPLRFHATKPSPARPADPSKDLFWVEEDDLSAGTVGVGEENPPNSLATPYTREGLARRLLETHYDAWLSLQEQGANTLFLALGMLRWRESEDDAAPIRHAPLVLVPARLDRKSARSSWQLFALDEEPGVNLSLVEKLKEFGIRLPPAPDLEAVEGLERYAGAVAEAVAGKPSWAVERDRVVLGFFSFGKFLMYRDLDPDAWPADRAPRSHELLSGILVDGFRDRGPALGPEDDLDARRPAGQTLEVMDADGSQAEALAEVATGRPLVIQGPPGTGKSQTISNMIAEAVFGGKRVLFVAEKMAALEVVKRRLENIGLGELCLELHSHKASKRDVAADLARTLALGKPEPAEGADLVEGLPALRDRLNRYARAVARPVGNSGLSPYQAIGTVERLRARPEPLPRIPQAPPADWTGEAFGRARALVQDLAAKVADVGVPREHPFEGCGLHQILPDRLEAVAALVREAGEATRCATGAASALAACIGAEPAADPASLSAGCALAEVALQAPDLRGVPPVGTAWDRPEHVEALAAAEDAIRSIRGVREAFDAKLAPDAWHADVGSARRDLVACGGSWWSRLFSSKYRAARRAVQGLCALPVPKRQADLVAVADAILKVQRLREELADKAAACAALAGGRFRGLDSRPEELRALREWGPRFREAAKRFPAPAGAWVVGSWDREALVRALAAAKEAAAAHAAAWARVGSSLGFPCDARPGLEVRAFEESARRADRWVAERGRLPGYAAYWKLNREVAALGLGELAALGHEGTATPEALPLVLDRARAEGVLDRALRERPELREFDAVTHEQAVQRFRRADAATFAANRARLAEAHWKKLPGGVGYGQVGLVRRESAKKARHLPIRRLMEQAGDAVQAIKPVFLMSPLSVAAYLPPGGPSFDLVVFDEASQVKPVDAFGAILRGRQLVVVGDDKQLPPTSFFEVMLSEEAVPDEDEGAAPSATQDLQSVLELCEAKGMPSRMLRWHYRSRHDSLIALSNREFYENRLVIFPSPARAPGGEGLAYRYLPETAYERGGSRTNPREADAVAQAVLDHARARPHLSLGVVAFSQPQREAVEARVEALSRKHAELDGFVNAPRDEPFFVKNLENVQGDERDVMMISVGYGRDAQGGLSMNFGPLNQAGGERRLNVLMTRARRQCVVFTNLQPEDLDLRRAPGAGVRAFKAFLAFARDGRLGDAPASGAGPGSEFEAEVRAALERRGYAVESQVGSGGYRIDLAVADPSTPGRYLLGIECDGAGYRDARWARDRDRLREAVLRGLGWRIHRVWCTDWYRNREETLRRCVGAIEGARESQAAGPAAPAPARLKRAAHVPPPGREPAPPYKPAKTAAQVGDRHLAEVDPAKLAEFAAGIVDREGPIHVEELRRRILDTVDARAGTKRLAAIDEAVERGAARGRLRRRGEFLWPMEERPVVARDRSELPDPSRSLDLVCDEECRAALVRVVEEACGCDADEAAGQAIRLLGVKRNESAQERLAGLVEAMVREGVLARRAAGLLTLLRSC
jgi:very-short-patch-repair endonuclease